MKNEFKQEFYYAETNLEAFGQESQRISGGLALLGTSGRAELQVGVVEGCVTENVELIVLAGTEVRVLDASADFRAQMFVFSREIYEETALRLGISFSEYMARSPFYSLVEGSAFLKSSQVGMAMAKLIDSEGENEFVGLMRRNFVQNYFFYLYDKCLSSMGGTGNPYAGRGRHFYGFLSLLDRHVMAERGVGFYAERLCITARYLAKVVAEGAPGMSPKSLIDKRLIGEIKVMLQRGDESVQQVAEALHFPDQSYLCRYFKRHTGISPSEYRSGVARELRDKL
jgi:AraC-like DNA-binding protein